MTNIYALIDPRSNECRYVGKADTPERRLVSHTSPSKLMSQTRKTCWLVNLLSEGYKPILIILERVAKLEWAESEQFWIAYMKSLGARLTNDNNGGISFEMSAEARRKLGAKAKNRVGHLSSLYGKQRSPETRAKISAGNKGKKKSLAHAEKCRANLEVARLRPDAVEKARIYHATPPSAETRKKMSEAAKKRIGPLASRFGSSPTASTREKIAAAGIGRKAAPETRVKMSQSQKNRWQASKSTSTGRLI